MILKRLYESTTFTLSHCQLICLNRYFLLVVGLQIVFNISKPENCRVQLLQIKCQECSSTTYLDINEKKNYWISMPQFLSDSGLNPLLTRSIITKIVGSRDSDVYGRYLAHYSPISPKIEARFQIIH